MVGKRQQPARDGVARGLRTSAEEQAEEQVKLDFERKCAESPSSSTVAFATTDSMSSVGLARFAEISSCP